MKKHFKVVDLFASNGSTYKDKVFFNSTDVLKNDLRDGTFQIETQVITINPNIQLDVFKLQDWAFTADIVYLDPPHLKNGTTGIMAQKYTTLPLYWMEALNNMFHNASLIAPVTNLKWCDSNYLLTDVLKLAEPYFFVAYGNRRISKGGRETTFITLIRKNKQNEH